MGKWMNQSINPSVEPEAGEHILVEDLARLVDGGVEPGERKRLIGHLNRCQRCYETLQDTLNDLSAETLQLPVPVPWWKTKIAFALAASIILVLLIGGPPAIKHLTQRSPVILATLNLDQTLKDILLEDSALEWHKKERVNRLLAALQLRGVQIKELTLVVLTKPYYQKKSLFGPEEVLHVRIENKVAYLEIKEKD
jgi:hypothetical protein